MSRLVSIIIPCYNAEQWIREAVESVLGQTHSAIEVIVVDDGSTDRSVEILRAYGDRIVLEVGGNHGANHARNRGFAISRGDFIQYLDADDYLLPDKIERQVDFLERSGADVVYGDWRHQYHTGDAIKMGDLVQSGARPDIVEALLDGWWVAPCSLLLRRRVVKSNSWDESLAAAQDRDFFIGVALSGAKICYQPGCNSIYRRYGDITTSTSNRERWLDNHNAVLTKAWKKLEGVGKLTDSYRRALAQSYFALARNYFDIDREKYASAMTKVLSLDPNFRSRESYLYKTIQRFLGYSAAEHLAAFKRRYSR